MTEIILDLGGGNTCKNDTAVIKRMIDEIAEVDSHTNTIFLKWQLWSKVNPQGNNERLLEKSFLYAYNYAKEKGYKTTASVFDKQSLEYLLSFDIPFVKIANNKDLYWLIGEVPRKVPVYASTRGSDQLKGVANITELFCVSKYPARVTDYTNVMQVCRNISDHTVGFQLLDYYDPLVWEKHVKLSDSIGLDAGEWAATPQELKGIL
jgi:sialic acid synthase SpsE